MKPSRFRYAAPRTTAEALHLLAEYGEDCKVIAGGQSLGPLLNLRLSVPDVLVDLGRIAELATAPVVRDGHLHVSAMSRQRRLELDALVSRSVPLLSQGLPCVAHTTIRNRGTLGGSVAHADPAAELPAIAVASDAHVLARRSSGRRAISAQEFFHGYFSTDLAADELLEAVVFPVVPRGSGSAWLEFAPRHGDFAIVGVAARLDLNVEGTIGAGRLVYSGIADVPWWDAELDQMLHGARATRHVFEEVAAAAGARCSPAGDLVGSAAYRTELVISLTLSALESATRASEADWAS